MRLGFYRFLKILLSSFFIQTSWSFVSMQGLGFLCSLLVGGKHDQRGKVIRLHNGLFNTHPYMASYLIGATVRAYDEGTSSAEDIKRYITIAQASFASTGDLLFWQTIRPSLALLAVILGIKFGIIGPLVFFITYNILHLYYRARGITDGYRLGWDVIYLLKSRQFTFAQTHFEIFGAFFSGLLITLISIKLGYLLVIPLSILFMVLITRRYSAVSIIITLLLLLITLVMVLTYGV